RWKRQNIVLHAIEKFSERLDEMRKLLAKCSRTIRRLGSNALYRLCELLSRVLQFSVRGSRLIGGRRLECKIHPLAGLCHCVYGINKRFVLPHEWHSGFNFCPARFVHEGALSGFEFCGRRRSPPFKFSLEIGRFL